MKKCLHCGHENPDVMVVCDRCKTALPVESNPIQFVPTPSGITHWIWDYFAAKRRRYYTAGFLIALFSALIGVIRGWSKGGSTLFAVAVFAVPVMVASGVGAGWLILFLERKNAKLERDRADGSPVLGLKVLFVLLGLVALVVIAGIILGIIVGVFAFLN